MIPDRVLLVALYVVLLVFLAVVSVAGDDGMTTCQLTHSFEVCHDVLH